MNHCDYWRVIFLFFAVLSMGNAEVVRAPLVQATWHNQTSKTECLLQQVIPEYGAIGFRQQAGYDLQFFYHSGYGLPAIEKASFFIASAPWRHEPVYRRDYPVFQNDRSAVYVNVAAADAALDALLEGQSAVFQIIAAGEYFYITALPIGLNAYLPQFQACLKALPPFNKKQLQGVIFFHPARTQPGDGDLKRLQHITRYLQEFKNTKVVIGDETYAVTKTDKKVFERRARHIKQALIKFGTPANRIVIRMAASSSGKNTLLLRVFGPDGLMRYYYRKRSTRLSFTERRRLDKLAEYVSQFYKTGHIIISSHTDSKGRRADNLKVSQKRGDVVKQYLVARGIPASRIIVKAYGESRPVKSNRYPPGRAMNRRVEIRFRP